MTVNKPRTFFCFSRPAIGLVAAILLLSSCKPGAESESTSQSDGSTGPDCEVARAGSCLIKLLHQNNGDTVQVYADEKGRPLLNKTFSGRVKLLRPAKSSVAVEQSDQCGLNLEKGKTAFGLEIETDGLHDYSFYSADGQPAELFHLEKFPEITIDEENKRHELFIKDILPDWGAVTVAPQMVLFWNGKRLTVDREAHLPKPTADIAEEFKHIESSDDADALLTQAPAELAERTLDLIYQGRTEEARRFFDSQWPAKSKAKTREAYWQMLQAKCKESRLWTYISASRSL